MSLLMGLPLGAFAQNLVAESATVDCGQVLFRSPLTVEYKLTNKGTKPVVIDDIRTNCGCTVVNFPHQNIQPGTSVNIQAVFDAKQLGHFDKKIGIYEQGGKEPLMLSLNGIVVQFITDFKGEFKASVENFLLEDGEIEFDDVNRGDQPVQKIYIKNTTDSDVEPVVMHLPAWLSANVSPSILGPHRIGEIYFTLNSKKLRDFGLTQTTVYLGDHPGDRVGENKEINVSAIVLPDFDNLTSKMKANAPVAELSSTTLDLGEFGDKKKLKGELEIKNTGKRELEIRNLQMFTSGLEISLSSMKIKPGEVGKLKVTATPDLKKVKGRPRILMITNDPKHPKIILNILAK